MRLLTPNRRQWRRSLLRLGLCALILAPGAASAVSGSLEDRLRAAYLFNFARFTQWPDEDNSRRVEFCVVADAPLRQVLEETLKGKDIRGRSLRVVAPKRPAEAVSCQILYLPEMDEVQQGQWLDALAERPVLTVGESRAFARRGGMVGFHLAEQRLRFAINPDTVYRAGMRMSSQLLKLADLEGGN